VDRRILHGQALNTDQPGLVNLGLVGAGAWGKNYISCIEECSGVRLSAIADRNPASQIFNEPGLKVFNDLDGILSIEHLDGIIVASPTPSHYSISAKILEKGLAVLVEKPLTNDPRSAKEIERIAKSKGLVVRVNHIDLANPAWRAVLQQIPSIGPLRRLHGAWTGDGPFRADTPGRWDYGSHAIAVALDAIGADPKIVEARRIAGKGSTEVVEVQMFWNDGVVATLQFGNAASEKRRQIIVEGALGTLEYDDMKDTKAFKNGEPLEYPDQPPLRTAVLDFVDSIRAPEPTFDSIEMGVRVVSTLAQVDLAGGF
jgi:predicted dehydrogenase